MSNKKCVTCGYVKLLDDFYVRKQATNGYESRCKECNKQNRRMNVKRRKEAKPQEDLLRETIVQFKNMGLNSKQVSDKLDIPLPRVNSLWVTVHNFI